MRAILALALSLASACAHTPPSRGPTAPATWEQPWRTMRAQHRVELEVETEPGTKIHRALRGVIAIERPGLLRLRALGPAGITFFEIVRNGSDMTVLNSLKDPKGSVLEKVIPSLEADLVAAYRLEPAREVNEVKVSGDVATSLSASRDVTLSRFVQVGAHVVATHIDIVVRSPVAYHVKIDASDIELDEPLDPALFRW